MTCFELLCCLTSQLSTSGRDSIEHKWSEVINHYGLMGFALDAAPAMMVKESNTTPHKRTALETVAVQVFVNSHTLDYFAIRDIVREVLSK